MFKFLPPLAAAILLSACAAPAQKPAAAPDAHTSRQSLDWPGSYAASCLAPIAPASTLSSRSAPMASMN